MHEELLVYKFSTFMYNMLFGESKDGFYDHFLFFWAKEQDEKTLFTVFTHLMCNKWVKFFRIVRLNTWNCLKLLVWWPKLSCLRSGTKIKKLIFYTSKYNNLYSLLWSMGHTFKLTFHVFFFLFKQLSVD